jgi:hypothetical protein
MVHFVCFAEAGLTDFVCAQLLDIVRCAGKHLRSRDIAENMSGTIPPLWLRVLLPLGPASHKRAFGR